MVTSEDLALDYSHEKRGLFCFDFFGFGAVFYCMWYVYTYSAKEPGIPLKDHRLLLYFALVVVGIASYWARRKAFNRNNSCMTEIASVAFFAVLYIFATETVTESTLGNHAAVVASIVLLAILFFIYGHSGKQRHAKAKKVFDEISDRKNYDPSSETDRVKRLCIEDLLELCPSVLEPMTHTMFFSKVSKVKTSRPFSFITNNKIVVYIKTKFIGWIKSTKLYEKYSKKEADNAPTIEQSIANLVRAISGKEKNSCVINDDAFDLDTKKMIHCYEGLFAVMIILLALVYFYVSPSHL